MEYQQVANGSTISGTMTNQNTDVVEEPANLEDVVLIVDQPRSTINSFKNSITSHSIRWKGQTWLRTTTRPETTVISDKKLAVSTHEMSTITISATSTIRVKLTKEKETKSNSSYRTETLFHIHLWILHRQFSFFSFLIFCFSCFLITYAS